MIIRATKISNQGKKPKYEIFLMALVASLAIATLQACATTGTVPNDKETEEKSEFDIAENIRTHTLSFDFHGNPIDPARSLAGWSQEYSPMTHAEYSSHIKKILRKIEACKPKEVLIFIHGGLNTLQDTYKRIDQLVPGLISESATWNCDPNRIYPVFISWNSNAVTSYMTQLLEDFPDPFKFYGNLVLDLTLSMLKIPVHAVTRELPIMELLTGLSRTRDEEAASLTRAAINHGRDLPTVKMKTEDENEMPGFFSLRYGPARYLAAPLKLPLVGGVDVMGTRAWLGMKASLSDVVELSDSSDVMTRKKEDKSPLLEFFKQLAEKKDLLKDSGQPFKVNLFAHSMGAIIANRLLNFANQRVDNSSQMPHFTKIVYMAAACEIRDLEDTVYPYLSWGNRNVGDPGNAKTEFYNLMLHPLNERTERRGYEFLPTGSLLVWIDEFYEPQESRKTLTAGRWVNFMSQIYDIPKNVVKFVKIRVFPINTKEKKNIPVDHGGFTQADFWTTDFRGEK